MPCCCVNTHTHTYTHNHSQLDPVKATVRLFDGEASQAGARRRNVFVDHAQRILANMHAAVHLNVTYRFKTDEMWEKVMKVRMRVQGGWHAVVGMRWWAWAWCVAECSVCVVVARVCSHA